MKKSGLLIFISLLLVTIAVLQLSHLFNRKDSPTAVTALCEFYHENANQEESSLALQDIEVFCRDLCKYYKFIYFAEDHSETESFCVKIKTKHL